MDPVIKHREVGFCSVTDKSNKSQGAVELLNNIDGVLLSHSLTSHTIHVAYDLHIIHLELIEEQLTKSGFNLDNSILANVRRAIIFYCEEAQLENLHNEARNESEGDVHAADIVNQRQRKHPSHVCRDNRPEHWRKYL